MPFITKKFKIQYGEIYMINGESVEITGRKFKIQYGEIYILLSSSPFCYIH